MLYEGIWRKEVFMKKKSIKVLALTVAMCLAITTVMTGCSKKKEPEDKVMYTNPLTGIQTEEPVETPRPLQVSIDNVGDAIPQSWLSKADIIYEVPVEGSQTRLQAIFYTQFPETFGPIRSTRPYFVDIAREYKAVFLAHGWSPEAKSYLLSNVIPYINAMNSGLPFYRVSDKTAPHNSYIKWEDVKGEIESRGWWDEKLEIKPFQFREAKVDDEDEDSKAKDSKDKDAKDEEGQDENVVKASSITIRYGNSGCEYTYDEETNLYTRTRYGNKYIDKETGESITTSNILIQRVTSKVTDAKGRLQINMCSGGNATLYTAGEVIEGTWSRADLDSRTIFVDKDGNEFQLTPGTTWIQLCDQGCKVTAE